MDDWEEAEVSEFSRMKSRMRPIGRAPIPSAMVRAIEDSNKRALLERAKEDEERLAPTMEGAGLTMRRFEIGAFDRQPQFSHLDNTLHAAQTLKEASTRLYTSPPTGTNAESARAPTMVKPSPTSYQNVVASDLRNMVPLPEEITTPDNAHLSQFMCGPVPTYPERQPNRNPGEGDVSMPLTECCTHGIPISDYCPYRKRRDCSLVLGAEPRATNMDNATTFAPCRDNDATRAGAAPAGSLKPLIDDELLAELEGLEQSVD